MSIIIVDFDHYEMLHSLIKCIEQNTECIYICSKKHIIDELKQNSYSEKVTFNWIIATNSEELINQHIIFQGMYFDYVILNTIYSHFGSAICWLEKLKYHKSILTIHNVNYWFKMGTRYRVFKRPRSSNHIQMLSLVDKVDALLLLSDNVKEYALKTYRIKKPIIVFPYTVNESVNIEQSNIDKIVVVIPGIIEEGRKDYIYALDVFSKLDKSRYKLVLLGRPKGFYGETVINKCHELKLQGLDIIYFKEYVQQIDFELWMNKTDIILAPVIIDTQYAGIKEKYGQSKETGAVFDIVRYGKPGIIPTKLITSKPINAACLRYESPKELLAMLTVLNNKDALLNLKQNAILAASIYYYKNVSKRLFDILKSI